jgi:hypothetical protein
LITSGFQGTDARHMSVVREKFILSFNWEDKKEEFSERTLSDDQNGRGELQLVTLEFP